MIIVNQFVSIQFESISFISVIPLGCISILEKALIIEGIDIQTHKKSVKETSSLTEGDPPRNKCSQKI